MGFSRGNDGMVVNEMCGYLQSNYNSISLPTGKGGMNSEKKCDAVL
jgi:hypothetical protein